MLAGKEDDRDSGQARGGPDRTDQQKGLAPEPVNHRHRDHGEEQVSGADCDRLQVAGHLAEAGVGENIIQVIEDRVNAGKLVKHSNADRQKNRQSEFSGEQLSR